MKEQKTNLQKLAQLLALVMLGVLLNAADMALSLLPNIELVTPLLIVYAYKFGIKALIPAYIYAFVEIFLYGINIWNIMYLYVWALAVLLALPLVKIKKPAVTVWALPVFAGIYGLCFGALCSIPYFFTIGPEYAISWIISGFSFDIIHAVSNFLTTLCLYIPLTKVMDKIKI